MPISNKTEHKGKIPVCFDFLHRHQDSASIVIVGNQASLIETYCSDFAFKVSMIFWFLLARSSLDN